MSETLGSLIDKLTIKDIREFHLAQMFRDKKSKFPKADLKDKLGRLRKQKKDLLEEIDCFVSASISSGRAFRDEKLKIYNAPSDIGRIPATSSLAEAISGLAQKNLELWHLEDEARRVDAGLAYVGRIKRRIDLANQQRNDFIDRIDELFSKKIKKS